MAEKLPGNISPAFGAMLDHLPANAPMDAIVVCRPAAVEPAAEMIRAPQVQAEHRRELSERHEITIDRLVRGYLRSAGRRLRGQRPSVTRLGPLPAAAFEVTPATIGALAAQPGVVAVLPNQPARLIAPRDLVVGGSDDEERSAGATWGLRQMQIPELWQTTRGAGITVAVFDTGVYGNHPALAGRVKDFVVIDPQGRQIATSAPFDIGRHGTHVCGTIAGGTTAEGIAIGVAPEVSLLVATVLLGDTTLRTIMEGIGWAVERGAHIINMSLGFSYYEPLFGEVFATLLKSFDVVPVVAIGNESTGHSSSPGNVSSALAVGAVEQTPRGLDVAFYSGGASLLLPGQTIDDLVVKPDIVAPGSRIYSCLPPEPYSEGVYEYGIVDGTSMAAPHVAGALALLMAAFPKTSAETIVDALTMTAAHPNGTARPDNRWGHGAARPLAALALLGAGGDG